MMEGNNVSPSNGGDPETRYVQMEDGMAHRQGGHVMASPTSTLSSAGQLDSSFGNTGGFGPVTPQNTNTGAGFVHFDSIALDKARADERHPSERNDGQHTYAESILSSVLTTDCISDPVGFYVVCFVVLVGDMSRGAMFPTLWPLVETIGGDEVTLGFAVAAFSFGRILVSPFFGSQSMKHGYTKTLSVSVTILLLGTLLYAQVVYIGSSYFLIFAQTILGVGSGTLGVTRAFVADVTPTRNRTTYMAWLTAVQYAGFTVTPFVGACFSKIFNDNGRGNQTGLFVLNEYSAPAYFMSLICIITLILIYLFFQDRTRQKSEMKKKSRKQQEIDDAANRTTAIGLTVYDSCILGCMLLNVATKGSIASFETLGIAFAASQFDLSSAAAGSIVAACGTLGVISLLSMGKLALILSDIQMIVSGIFVMIIGVLSLMGLPNDGESSATWRYWIAIFLIYSIGYPIGHTAVIGLFSKIVGRRPQGTLLGWFASAGSVARIVFPVMSGSVAHVASIEVVFIILSCVLAIAIIFTFFARPTLENLIR